MDDVVGNNNLRTLNLVHETSLSFLYINAEKKEKGIAKA